MSLPLSGSRGVCYNQSKYFVQKRKAVYEWG